MTKHRKVKQIESFLQRTTMPDKKEMGSHLDLLLVVVKAAASQYAELFGFSDGKNARVFVA